MKHYMLFVFGTLMTILLSGCLQVDETEDNAEFNQKGHLVMLGGGPRPDSVMKHVVSLSQDSTFLLIPMASSIPDTIGWEQRDQLLDYGAKSVEILMLTDADKSNSELMEKLKNARGIWFSGGDQNRLMDYFSEEMREAVREAYFHGAVIAGTSAGTAVQSSTMITGDEQYPLSTRFDAFSQIRTDNVITADGFDLLNGMIADQHFIKRNRLNRLINALSDSPNDTAAVGIDEATALWLAPDGRAEVLGESQVILLEKTNEFDSVSIDGLSGALNIKMHILPPGSVFYWKNGVITDMTFRLD